MRDFLDGKEKLSHAQMVSHRDCDLGKWLYSEGMGKFGSLPEKVELEEIHKNIHAVIKEIVRLKEAGETSKAEQTFLKIEPISEQVVSHLLSLDKKC